MEAEDGDGLDLAPADIDSLKNAKTAPSRTRLSLVPSRAREQAVI